MRPISIIEGVGITFWIDERLLDLHTDIWSVWSVVEIVFSLISDSDYDLFDLTVTPAY